MAKKRQKDGRRTAQQQFELLIQLVVTDLKLKYKGTALGFFWSFLQPLLIICTLIFVFSKMFRPDMPNYAAFLVIGFIVWNFFRTGTSTLNTIVSKESLISKIHFTRELVVISASLVVLINSFFEMLMLMIVLFIIGTPITKALLFFPVIFILQYIFVLGTSFMLSALFVRFRDLDNIWSVFLEAMFFATPIIYPNSLLLPDFPLLLILNPMTHFITNYRKIILYGTPLTLSSFFILTAISFGFLMLGLTIFNKRKSSFVEDL